MPNLSLFKPDFGGWQPMVKHYECIFRQNNVFQEFLAKFSFAIEEELTKQNES